MYLFHRPAPRAWGLFLAALFTVSSVHAQGPLTTSTTLLKAFHRYTLPNGMEVILLENHSQPLVRVELVVRNGAFTEGPEYSGLSHLYEHLFFRGNETYRTQAAMDNEMFLAGGLDNATTNEEHVNYFCTLPIYNLAKGLELMSAAIRTPLFNQSDIEKEQEIVLAEFDRHEAHPFFIYNRAMDSALWGPMITRKEPLGLRSVIRNATQEKMRVIQKKYYIPNNTLLILAGDLDVEETRSAVENYFGDWERGPDPFAVDPPQRAPALTGKKLVQRVAGTDQVYMSFNWHGPSIGLDDRSSYAADVLISILGQRLCKFQQHLVRNGPALSASMGWPTRRYIGEISLDLSVPVRSAREGMRAMWKEVESLADPDYFTDEELDIAKQRLWTHLLDDYDDINEYTHTLAFWWGAAGTEYYFNYLNNIRNVTREDIQRYVKAYIIDKPYILGVATSEENIWEMNLREEELP